MDYHKVLNENINIVELFSVYKKRPLYYKGSLDVVLDIIDKLKIKDFKINYLTKSSKCALLDYSKLDVRIEPGVFIRDGVILKKGVIVLSGAVINIGAEIGEKTLIDMNCSIGSNVKIGMNCHISAGVVISGVIEPVSKKNVEIGDNVLIGANSVILEGVTVGSNSVIGAGSIQKMFYQIV